MEATISKKILFKENDWIIVQCLYNDKLYLFAEHWIGCEYRNKEEKWCKASAYWSWEHDDRDDPAMCWECNAEVPDDIVGMVKMLNWNKLER